MVGALPLSTVTRVSHQSDEAMRLAGRTTAIITAGSSAASLLRRRSPYTIQSVTQIYRSHSTNAALSPQGSKLDALKAPILKIEDKSICVHWADGKATSHYLHLWLRDHCRCQICFHQITKQRLLNTFEIPTDIRPAHVEASQNGLNVIWKQNGEAHESFYPWYWLRRDQRSRTQANKKVIWGAEISKQPPEVEHRHVMEDDYALWDFLRKMEDFGVCFIRGVPATTDETEQLALRISRIRHTQYGGFWDFTSDLAKGDTAYTTLALGAHTDTTYFTDPCGLQLFHLLSHTDGSGGSTLLVDGFRAAAHLRTHHPEAYGTLATVRVPTHAAGEPREFFRPTPAAGYPVLNRDPYTGDLYQVRYNNDDRSVMHGMGVEELEQWYRALRLWDQLLKGSDSEYWVQLKPGTAVVVDNHRVLHGRSAFTGRRRMCGAYIGMDDFRSRLASLSERFEGGVDSGNNHERSSWSPLL